MKFSYSLRAFGLYFVILGSLIWFTLDNAIERLNDGMRQSAESVLVDIANILAAYIEDEVNHPGSAAELNIGQLEKVFKSLDQRPLSAKIYQVTKSSIDSQVYVTDQLGMVIYDSTGLHTGEDFSKWRDVHLTLAGEYGARTSFISQKNTEPDDPKAMIIAAPIRQGREIIGSVSVLKPINSLEGHLLTETKQLQRYAFALLLLALFLGYLLSIWFTHSLNKIANYANDMAEGKNIEPPILQDSRLADLTDSISYMRTQIDGKEYVENYIHSLTHELKTPITSIRGAVELLSENMPAEDRARFISNISTSNQRMSRLVDRMLSLAKLEGLTELVATSEFDLVPTLNRMIQERSPTIDARRIEIVCALQSSFHCIGDKVLISQAVANLMDNAIGFCKQHGQVEIRLHKRKVAEATQYKVTLHNQGEPIPGFALHKLYDRFFSLPRPSEAHGACKSTGLGLSFVKEVMKLHKGTIAVKNTESGVISTLVWPVSLY